MRTKNYVVGLLGFGCALLVMANVSEAGTLVGPGQDNFDRAVGQVSDGNRQLNYEFFRPPGHDTGGELPLVVFLHGFTDGLPFKQSRLNDTMLDLVHATQRDNLGRGVSDTSLAEQFDDDFSAYLFVPKIPIVRGWSSYLDLTLGLIQDFGSQYQVDTRRIYLTGFSNGGFATVDLIKQYPDLFAAGVPISGGGSPSSSTVDALKDVPFWFFHGANDSVVRPSSSSRLANALVAAGGDTQLTLVPGGGHNSGYEFAFRDSDNQFYPWLFNQSLPVPEPGTCFLAVVASVFLPIVGVRSTRVRRFGPQVK